MTAPWDGDDAVNRVNMIRSRSNVLGQTGSLVWTEHRAHSLCWHRGIVYYYFTIHVCVYVWKVCSCEQTVLLVCGHRSALACTGLCIYVCGREFDAESLTHWAEIQLSKLWPSKRVCMHRTVCFKLHVSTPSEPRGLALRSVIGWQKAVCTAFARK